MTIIKNLLISDLIGVNTQFESYIKSTLGYDTCTVKVEIYEDKMEITCNAVDAFMQKLDYGDRYNLCVYEINSVEDELSELTLDVWEKLLKHLPRPARELRYSLICLSKVTEAELDIDSEIAKSVFAEIKNLKDKLSERLLSYQPETSSDE